MGDREALTVRFPLDLLARARSLKTTGESLNDLVIAAVEREVRRRQGLDAFADILRIREEVRRKSEPQASSADYVRVLRAGDNRWDRRDLLP